MLEFVRTVVIGIENDRSILTRDQVLSSLRSLGIEDFGEVLLTMPNEYFPRISQVLPSMASAEVQNQWTGSNGIVLLRQTCSFVRSASYNYNRITNRSLSNTALLDYGCGYGRIARLMYYFTDSGNLVGIDPWDKSIEQCKLHKMGPNFLVSDYLPEKLPTAKMFDFAYAFSVFTHLSKRAALCSLNAVRRSMKPGGIFCLTIRPIEYWDLDLNSVTIEEKARLKADHIESGFAFRPHSRPPVDGDITYGDTSISLEWLDKNLNGWKRVSIDRSLEDPYQIYVFVIAT